MQTRAGLVQPCPVPDAKSEVELCTCLARGADACKNTRVMLAVLKAQAFILSGLALLPLPACLYVSFCGLCKHQSELLHTLNVH